MQTTNSAFTVIELIVVLLIIIALSSLITVAVTPTSCGPGSRRTSIVLELQLLGLALEDTKNEIGAYPPNAMANSVIDSSEAVRISSTDILLFFKKAFPRIESLKVCSSRWLERLGKEVTRPL